MIRAGLIFRAEEWPFGLRCMDCHNEITEGQEYADRLSGMVEDIPMNEVICGACAASDGNTASGES